MHWYEKHLLDKAFPNDKELTELKFLITKEESANKSDYSLWLATLAGLYTRLDNRYIELTKERD
jgi:hypothetical protein